MILNGYQAHALAMYVAGRNLASEWELDWGDLPELDEASFELVVKQVTELGKRMIRDSTHFRSIDRRNPDTGKLIEFNGEELWKDAC